eukprot:g6996.t1
MSKIKSPGSDREGSDPSSSHKKTSTQQHQRGGAGAVESSVRGGTGGRAVARGGLLIRSMSMLDNERVFEQSMSHSTIEWRDMSKAGRVLGVDSLEERYMEDQRHASSVKAARILGVRVDDLQQSAAAARERRKWAPSRSNASKAARMLGVQPVSARGVGGKCGSGSASKLKRRRVGITSLIRALEINGSSRAGSIEDGDCSSVDDNGSEDLTRRKGRGKQAPATPCLNEEGWVPLHQTPLCSFDFSGGHPAIRRPVLAEGGGTEAAKHVLVFRPPAEGDGARPASGDGDALAAARDTGPSIGSRDSVPGYVFPLASVGGRESSGESDSMCDTIPNQMDEGDGPSPSSAFEALAAMIPVVNPMGIGRQQVPKLGRRRRAVAAPVNAGGVPVILSPMASIEKSFRKVGGGVRNAAAAGAVSPGSRSSGHDGMGGGGGISTRKHQEVTTRPRANWSFVKRAPTFLPISAFKPQSEAAEEA